MKTIEFDYDLPEKYIAQYPPKVRGTTNLLVLNKETGEIRHSKYFKLDEFLDPGDCVVLNDTKVIPARLFATDLERRKRVELFLLKNINPTENVWEVLIGGARKVKNEQFLLLEDGKTQVEIIQNEHGKPRLIKFPKAAHKVIEDIGHTPLPPYIKRKATTEDTKRYQTIFAKIRGAVAAPTASLNFTENLIEKLKKKGVKIVYVTLHVGWDTFVPVKEKHIEEHEIHSEWFSLGKKDAEVINEVRRKGGKILAAGTTVTRVLETVSDQKGFVKTFTGESRLFIYPGYKFKCIDILLTNFHAPKTTVLLLATAFAGKNNLLKSYAEAKEKKYKFLSYGDSMLIT